MQENNPKFDLAIVGTGPAGFSASVYASRYEMKNIVIGKILGGQASEAHRICNYPGFPEIHGQEIMRKFHDHAAELGASIAFDTVAKIEGKLGNFRITTTTGKTYNSSVILLAHGAHHRKLGLPEEDQFLGKGLAYCATCDGPLFRDKVVAVVGGSDAATTASLYLAEICKKVYQIYRKDKLRGEKAWINLATNNPKIEIIYNTNIKKIVGENKVENIELDKEFNGSNKLPIDGLFVEIGSEPDKTLSSMLGLQTDAEGYIQIDSSQATNIPGIFAAGDVTTGSNGFRQVITAAAEGAIAAQSAFKVLEEIKENQI